MNETKEIAKTITFRQLKEVADAARREGAASGTYPYQWHFLYLPQRGLSEMTVHYGGGFLPKFASSSLIKEGTMMARPFRIGRGETFWFYEFEGALF